MNKELTMTPREAARALEIRLDTIYGLIWASKLRAKKSEGRWLVSAKAVEERLRQREARNA